MQRRHLTILGLSLALAPATTALLSGCAGLALRQPLQVSLADVSSLPAEGLELRLAVKLRVQNPNDAALDYDGVWLALEVGGRHLASGVSDVRGSVPRFGEALITLPVTVSPAHVLRQAWGLAREGAAGLDFTARGHLAGGIFGGASFVSSGRLDWPAAPVR